MMHLYVVTIFNCYYIYLFFKKQKEKSLNTNIEEVHSSQQIREEAYHQNFQFQFEFTLCCCSSTLNPKLISRSQPNQDSIPVRGTKTMPQETVPRLLQMAPPRTPETNL